MKKIWSLLLSLALLLSTGLSPITALAQDAAGDISSSEEVIYAVLSPEGEPDNIYAVVILNVSRSGTVTYYGDYKNVKNLTDTGELTYTNGILAARADAGRFYYQGDLISPDLPWSINIAYTLDGEAISPDDLAGADGHLEIRIETSRNENIDAIFYDNYLLQVSVPLDTECCENIVAENAALANSGAERLCTFTVMPAVEGEMTITADVTDFEMAGISISAVPYSTKSAIGSFENLTDGLYELADGINELTVGAAELADGAADISIGVSELKKGTLTYGDGLTQAAAGSGDLISSSAQILASLQQISAGLSGQSGGVDLSAMSQLPAGLIRLADALDQISAAMAELSNGFSAAKAAMASAVASIPAPSLSESDIAALLAANPNNNTLSVLVENYTAAQIVRATWSQVSSAFAAVETTLPELNSSVDTVSASLRAMAGQIETAIQSSDALSGLAELSQGIAALNSNYGAFHTGLVSYTKAVNGLANGWTDLRSGITDLSSGAYILSKGAAELSDGISAVNEETQSIPEELNALTGNTGDLDFEQISFLSEKNPNPDLLQFVIKTIPIEKPAPADAGDPASPVSTLWDRIKALFISG